MDKRRVTHMLLQAQRDNERYVTGIIGKTDNADITTIYATADKSEVWVRINGFAEPYRALIADPAAVVPKARVRLNYDVEADKWVIAGVNASANAHYFQNVGGFAFAVQPHNHTSEDTGGDLGDNTVGNGQLQAGAVTDDKVASGIDGAKLSAGTVGNTQLGIDSVDSDNIVDGSIDNVHLANDSVKVPNLNNLTASTNGYVRQNTSDQFLTEKLAFVNGTSPTTSDDSTQGYLSFSKWMDWANEKLWMAFDVFPSSASWKRFLFSGEVVPTDTDTLTGSSAAIVAQTASDTFTSIPYTLTDNRTLHYDGSTIRRRFVLATNTGGTVTTSLAASALIYITNNLGSDVDVAGSLIKCTFTLSFRGNTVGDVYDFSVQYNYNNGGVESWITYPSVTANTPFTETIFTANYIATRTYVAFFDFASVATAWGFGGNYYIRLIAARQSGTGALTVFSSGARARTAIIEEM